MKPLFPKYSYLKREKKFNKKLVKILNHKMFKGYRIAKESKKDMKKTPKFIEEYCNESKTIDPFDDYYSIEYKKKNLSSLYNVDFSNLLQINNVSRKSGDESGLIKKRHVPIQKGENFRKRTINLLRKSIDKDRYFYFSSNSQIIKKNSSETQDKSEQLYNSIFQDNNEKGLYNDIPIFAIEKIYKVPYNRNKKKLQLIKSKEERINDLQFLYKLSHEKPKKKIDFRNRFNIKSAKSSNIIEKSILKKMSKNFKANSAKNPKQYNFINYNKSIQINHEIPDLTIINSSLNIKNLTNQLKKNFSQIARKKLVKEIGTQIRDHQLRYTPSTGDLFVNKSKISNDENQMGGRRKSYSNIFQIDKRIINDKLLKDEFDFKKWKFFKLKKLMEI